MIVRGGHPIKRPLQPQRWRCADPSGAPRREHWPEQPSVRSAQPSNDGWLAYALSRLAAPRTIWAQQTLFRRGDPAHHYHLLLGGAVLLHRRPPGDPWTRPKAIVRRLADGDLFFVAAGGRHTATCDVLVDSVLIAIDRTCFERQAELDPTLARVRRAVLAREQSWLLQLHCGAGGDGPP